jgi:replication-associated recombination protein RarA
MFKRIIEVGTKILDALDDAYIPPTANNSDFQCSWDHTAEEIKPITLKKDSLFQYLVGYSDIKREFVKALDSSSPVLTLLVGSPGCGESEFLKHIRNHFENECVFIDESYGSKAGMFQVLYDKRSKYVLLDEIDKLSCADQQALLNLMENGRLTKITKSESYDIELNAWVFATADNKEKILELLLDSLRELRSRQADTD